MVLSHSGIMGQERWAFLNARRLPARLTVAETAIVLGLQEHDIPVLVAARMLEPLGKPAANAPKYFAAVDIISASENREWLAKATAALARRWREKNNRKKHGRNRVTHVLAEAG